LIESYRISVGLEPSERAILLNYLTRAAGAQHLSYTGAWAEENLRLAYQLPLNWNRVAIEKNALVALSYVKSKRALDLLRIMSLPVSDGVGFPEDVRADAATIIFQNYWHDHHSRGVPELRITALYLGQTGQYPYVAVAQVITDLTHGRSGPSGEFPPDAQTLLLDAYASYQRGSKFGVENDDFVDFLRALRPILPASLFRKGLELAVERLIDKDRPTDPQTYVARVYTEAGTAVFHTRRELLLFELIPLIREVDPSWAAQVVERDTALAQAGAHSGKDISTEGVVSPGEPERGGQPRDLENGLQGSRAQAVGDLSANNLAGALRMAQSIGDPALRAVALGNIAGAIGTTQPGETKDIESAIRDTVPAVKGNEDKLRAFSALANASSAATDMAGFQEAIDKCFALGEELFEEELTTHPGRPTYDTSAFNSLDAVVKSGARFDPGTIVAKVLQVRDDSLRAYLLPGLSETLYAKAGAKVNSKKPQVSH
jgi:hypothetical protein